MGWWLFLDDERFPAKGDWTIARTADDAKRMILSMGIPEFISFDHDLGDYGDNGSQFVTWLVEHMLDNGIRFPTKFTYDVHSQNPIGATNIRGKMDAAIKHIGWE